MLDKKCASTILKTFHFNPFSVGYWMGPVKIRVDQIQDKPMVLSAEEPVASFPVLIGMQNDTVCSFTSPVSYNVTIVKGHNHFVVSGRVNVMVSLTCSRCLTCYETGIASDFTRVFSRETTEKTLLEDEIELSEQDFVSVYTSDEIDMNSEIEEQIALEIPFRPLCSDECKGLCPECGTDLNYASCSCASQQFNFKFSALKDFKVSR